jgi:PAS domain S-box-containing protein
MAASTDQPITVLHVDDEPDFGELVADVLEEKYDRFSVETTTSASDALDRLTENSLDCIVSDYDMPGQNGIEFLKTVREDHPALPFVLFTGKDPKRWPVRPSRKASPTISRRMWEWISTRYSPIEWSTPWRNTAQNNSSIGPTGRWTAHAKGSHCSMRPGEFMYVNDAYTELVGYDELLGEFWELVYPDDQADRIDEGILSAVPEEEYWSGETVYLRKDRSRILVNYALAYSEEGTMICLPRDFTDDELQDRALKEERQRFDLFIQAVEEYAIFMLDTNGYIVTWNEGAERIKGYSEEEILGDHISTFYTQDQEDEGLPDRLLDEAKSSGSVSHEGPRVRKDGSTFEASVVITAVYDETGSHRGYGKVTQDLTDTSRQLNDDV